MVRSPIVIDMHCGALNPVIFGYEKCKSLHAFGPAVREYWLIHYVVSGFGSYEIGGNAYRVKPGEMFVIPPYRETFYRADAEKPWSYIWIGFTADELPMPLADVISCPAALQVFEEMKRCEEFNGGRSAFLAGKLWDLFSLLMEESRREEDYTEKALSCIHAEYMKGISVEDVAARLNLDRSYFSAIFREKMGISPGRYLFNLRMNLAAELLGEHGMSVSTTANSVGYRDIYNFSRMFKKHYGVPPSKYRK